MGTASTFLPAYTLATLHEVSVFAQVSAVQFGSTANAGRRLVGGREGSEAELSAPHSKLAFILMKEVVDRCVCLTWVPLLLPYHRTSLSLSHR